MQFEEIESQMPDLILEMRVDLKVSECGSIREFFVQRDRQQQTPDGAGGEPRFSYFESEHEHLRNKLLILADAGRIVLMKAGEVPIYPMTEEFAQELIVTWP